MNGFKLLMETCKVFSFLLFLRLSSNSKNSRLFPLALSFPFSRFYIPLCSPSFCLFSSSSFPFLPEASQQLFLACFSGFWFLFLFPNPSRSPFFFISRQKSLLVLSCVFSWSLGSSLFHSLSFTQQPTPALSLLSFSLAVHSKNPCGCCFSFLLYELPNLLNPRMKGADEGFVLAFTSSPPMGMCDCPLQAAKICSLHAAAIFFFFNNN